MIELGKVQELEIKRFKSVGAFLNEEGTDASEEDILLPKKYIPENANVGDVIKLMVYKDSGDRMIATTKYPYVQVGETGFLEVVNKTNFGYFLDWGLDKDVFLPFSETIGQLEIGRKYLIHLYIDKSTRICATMKIKDFLLNDPPYKEDEFVNGVIYGISRGLGAFIAVEGKYDGLLPEKEMFGAFEIGEKLVLRVSNVKPDGKLDLSLRERGHLQMDKDVATVYEKLLKNKGFLPYSDKSDSETITREFNMSKSGFKRAIGKLYKQRFILIDEKGITLLKGD